MDKVKFTEMKHGTKEDYDLLSKYEEGFVEGLSDRILQFLKNLDGSLDGYQITRLEHSLQTTHLPEPGGRVNNTPNPEQSSTPTGSYQTLQGQKCKIRPWRWVGTHSYGQSLEKNPWRRSPKRAHQWREQAMPHGTWG